MLLATKVETVSCATTHACEIKLFPCASAVVVVVSALLHLLLLPLLLLLYLLLPLLVVWSSRPLSGTIRRLGERGFAQDRILHR